MTPLTKKDRWIVVNVETGVVYNSRFETREDAADFASRQTRKTEEEHALFERVGGFRTKPTDVEEVPA